MLLRNYPECQASTIREAKEKLERDATGSDIRLQDENDANALSFRVNAIRLNNLSLVCASSNRAICITSAPASFIKHVFQLGGKSRLRWGRLDQLNQPDTGGCLIPEDATVQIDNVPNYQSLTLRIDPLAMKRTLSGLLGTEADIPQFSYGVLNDSIGMYSLRRAVIQLSMELDGAALSLATPVVNELSDAIVTKFLAFHRHSYSDRLSKPEAAPSEQQVRRIEDYIVSNWDKPFEIDVMAAALQVSGRTIFRAFRKARGYSPSDLFRNTRLEKAQMMLLNGDETTSVLSVALKCGFQSFGRFSQLYREMFGELPSTTLQKNRMNRSAKSSKR